MLSNNDNYDYNLFESFNIFNQENNEFICNNNCGFNPTNVNKQFLLENKNTQPAFDNTIYKENIFNINENCLKESKNNGLKKGNLSKTKSKKIFNIIHIKRKPIIDLDIENQKYIKKSKILEVSKIKENDINENKSLINYSLKSFENKEAKKVKHNKFSDDNLRRKSKHLVLFSIMEFINEKIYSMYKGNLGNNIYRKEILTLNKSQKSNSNISFNRIFANKKLSDILSDNISSRYSNYLPEHNKLLIERLKNDEDENKSIYFNKLFGLTFKDCLAHFIGKITLEELKGMKRFENIKEILGEDKEYINVLRYYLENFEDIIYNKNPRKPKKVKKLTLPEEKKENML